MSLPILLLFKLRIRNASKLNCKRPSLQMIYNLWTSFHVHGRVFVSENPFVNLTKLSSLFISSKSNLVLNVSSNWVPPFQL